MEGKQETLGVRDEVQLRDTYTQTQDIKMEMRAMSHLVVVVAGDDVPRHASEGVRGVHRVPGVREPVAVIVALDA